MNLNKDCNNNKNGIQKIGQKLIIIDFNNFEEKCNTLNNILLGFCKLQGSISWAFFSKIYHFIFLKKQNRLKFIMLNNGRVRCDDEMIKIIDILPYQYMNHHDSLKLRE